MKNILFLFVFAAFFTACKNEAKPTLKTSEATDVATTTTATTATAADVFTVDTTQSNVAWEGYEGLKLGKSEHNGTLKISSGKLDIANGSITGGSFSIPLSSLIVLDIPAGEKRNAKLKAHLLNADFFDAEKFPTADFSIASVAKTVGDSVAITGNLTLKGTAKSITFPALVKLENGVLTASTPKFYINRKDWGMSYRSENSFGDELIRPELGLSINLISKK
ncbi:MAG: YceI family protein [Saprospiraceae bacterium]|nr:YceI family protein [Saprospiraceae bacterium]